MSTDGKVEDIIFKIGDEVEAELVPFGDFVGRVKKVIDNDGFEYIVDFGDKNPGFRDVHLNGEDLKLTTVSYMKKMREASSRKSET